MSCDITLYRMTESSHPSKKEITLIEREEIWYDSSVEICILFASKYEDVIDHIFCVDSDEVAGFAQEILDYDAGDLDECDITALEVLIEVCSNEKAYPDSYNKMMIDY